MSSVISPPILPSLELYRYHLQLTTTNTTTTNTNNNNDHKQENHQITPDTDVITIQHVLAKIPYISTTQQPAQPRTRLLTKSAQLGDLVFTHSVSSLPGDYFTDPSIMVTWEDLASGIEHRLIVPASQDKARAQDKAVDTIPLHHPVLSNHGWNGTLALNTVKTQSKNPLLQFTVRWTSTNKNKTHIDIIYTWSRDDNKIVTLTVGSSSLMLISDKASDYENFTTVADK